MNFRYKCLMQSLFGLFPNSEDLNYLAQKYLSKSFSFRRTFYEEQFQNAMKHHKAFENYSNFEASNSTVYEIGCGRHLAMALVFSSLGYSNIKALDINNLLRIELLNSILHYLKDDNIIPDFVKFDSSQNLKERLLNEFNIDFLAPWDSANTGLADASVDFIYSTSVFEHIPPDALPKVMRECHRLLKDDGVVSISIDYSDHYTSIDENITPYNFLKYSEAQWKKYNPRLQYVNRMRHVDFVRLFKQTNFKIVEESVFRPDNWENIVNNFPFADEIAAKYSLDELSAISGYFVLKKLPQSDPC